MIPEPELGMLAKQSWPSVAASSKMSVAFRVVDDPTIDTTSRTGKLVMGILALIAEFENDIRRERQMDGIAKARERGVKFGRKLELTAERVSEIRLYMDANR
jgi:DNA invertase Pin-like site-specific DNA recombinase